MPNGDIFFNVLDLHVHVRMNMTQLHYQPQIILIPHQHSNSQERQTSLTPIITVMPRNTSLFVFCDHTEKLTHTQIIFRQ